jgi:hypothetical protein
VPSALHELLHSHLLVHVQPHKAWVMLILQMRKLKPERLCYLLAMDRAGISLPLSHPFHPTPVC